MNANNILQFKTVESEDPIIYSDYFESEKIPVSDMLSMLELLQKAKENGNT
jgi:hypothetical protein